MLQSIYFTLTAILLYLLADWILVRIEQRRGELLPHRNLVFFVLLLGLAVGTFALIRHFTGQA
ncbi:MAG: hypothetical protein D6786_02725 [Gammaproteobacteria bacterium]|nr:MAG: hypothetical protein D6786_02725 [Gammaproteobacteria bacterium]